MIDVFLKKARAEEAANVGYELSRLTNNVISNMVMMRKRCSENEDDVGK